MTGGNQDEAAKALENMKALLEQGTRFAIDAQDRLARAFEALDDGES